MSRNPSPQKRGHELLRGISLHLTPRTDGRFAKVIRGEYCYFGKDGDELGARRELIQYIQNLDRPAHADKVLLPLVRRCVADVVNWWLDEQEARASKGLIEHGTFDDYRVAVQGFCDHVGRGVLVDALTPEHFRNVRSMWSKRLGPYALDRHIQAVRTMFSAAAGRLIPDPPDYGNEFSKSTAADKRAAKRARESARGERRFTPEEIRAVLAVAPQPLKVFILLALNAGMYASEIADLRWSDLVRKGSELWIDADRPKTRIQRRAMLWPETVAALESYLSPDPGRKCLDPADQDRIFLTRFGRPWVREHEDHDAAGRLTTPKAADSIRLLFERCMRWDNQEDPKRIAARRRRGKEIVERPRHGIPKRHGVSFGALRATHVSEIGAHPDLNAARLVRGHQIRGIEEAYDHPDDDRIRDVVAFLHRRMLRPSDPTQAKPPEPKHVRLSRPF